MRRRGSFAASRAPIAMPTPAERPCPNEPVEASFEVDAALVGTVAAQPEVVAGDGEVPHRGDAAAGVEARIEVGTVKGQQDARGRNRQATWFFVRMDDVAGREITLRLTDLVAERLHRREPVDAAVGERPLGVVGPVGTSLRRDGVAHDALWGIVRVEVAETEDPSARADEVSRWVLAERAPLALPDSRWDRMAYPVRECEEFLRASS